MSMSRCSPSDGLRVSKRARVERFACNTNCPTVAEANPSNDGVVDCRVAPSARGAWSRAAMHGLICYRFACKPTRRLKHQSFPTSGGTHMKLKDLAAVAVVA